MKFITISIIYTVGIFFAQFAYADEQSWQFIESVGGMSLGRPFQDSKGWELPIECNISGITKVTTQPTVMKSGIACKKIDVHIEGANIYLTINTSVSGEGSQAQCPPAGLGNIAPGKYMVYYGTTEPRVKLKDIAIEP